MSGTNLVRLSDARRSSKSNDDGGETPPPERPKEVGPSTVTPLGHVDGHCWFFDGAGQLRALPAQAMGQSPQLVMLFGDEGWLVENFPAFNKEGKPTGWFSARDAGAYLVKECARRGLFRTDEPRRGVGVWRCPDGTAALHLGDQVVWLTDPQEVQKAGFRDKGALWPAFSPVARPSAPASAEDAAVIESLFGRWNWEEPNSNRVFFGLWVAGLLGAAIPWRPHGLVVGGAGTGKSSLLEFYGAVSPLAWFLNEFTEAGIRQNISGRAAPLLLDEAEGDTESAAALQRVIGLLRRTSGQRGAQVVRGSSGGKAQQFEVMSPAILGAILPPDLLPQDASRITRLDVRPRAQGNTKGLPDDGEIAWAKERAAALWGRAIASLPRFMQNLAVVRAELLGRGCVPRLADQVGTIIAARAAMLQDEPLSALEACDEADEVRWLIRTEEEQAPDSGPRAALNLLLQSPSDVQWSNERPTIGRLVALAQSGEDGSNAKRVLVEHGLLVAPWPRKSSGPCHLYVANSNPRLKRVFEGSAWAGGRWKDDLRRLPGAFEPRDPQTIGAAKPRVVIIPPDLLPPPPRGHMDQWGMEE